MAKARASKLVLSLAILTGTASAAHLTQDPLTQLPLPGFTDKSGFGNDPNEMPPARVCKSQYRGNFYSLDGTQLLSVLAWYADALKGFSHVQSADNSTHVFANAQRSIIVIVMGKAGGNASSVAYEKYEPGLSEKTIIGITRKAIDCS